MYHDIFILQSLGLSVFIEFRRGGIAGSLLNCRNIFLIEKNISTVLLSTKISHQLYGIRLDESIMVVIDPSCGGHAYMDMYQLHVPQFGRTSVQTKSPIFVSFIWVTGRPLLFSILPHGTVFVPRILRSESPRLCILSVFVHFTCLSYGRAVNNDWVTYIFSLRAAISGQVQGRSD